MANLCKPPNALSFTGNTAQNWRDFKEQLTWYLAGTEASEKSDLAKIGIMLSHAGKEARDVYKTFEWAAEGDDKKFEKVLEAFQRYCSPRKNIIYERHGFWTIQQEDHETIDAYLTRIRMKIDLCEYDKEGWPPAVRQELIRDKFVFGLADDGLKERLLREVDVSLTKAVETAQRAESSKRQVKEMVRASVNVVRESEQPRRQQQTLNVQCTQCGRRHKPRSCPAFGQQCSFCKKPNHFANMCWSKQALLSSKQAVKKGFNKKLDTKGVVYEVEPNDTSSDSSVDDPPSLTIDPVSVEGIKKVSSWFANLSTNSGNLNVKLDTGAEVSVLPLCTYNELQVKPPLKPTGLKLTAYGGTSITPSGTCKLACSGPSQNKWDVKFYVASVQAHPILGLSDCINLGLIKRVCTLEEGVLTKGMLKEKYPTVFKGLGNLGMYHITLQDKHTPVINPARRIPHSLKERLKKTIERNVQCGVLVKVDQPTDWVNNLVIVEKKNGTLRMCLDPKELNKAIKREHYRIPTMQEIASEFSGKKVFSTLDLKDGYWQIQLDEESSLLCTFNTPFGRYRFTRMPFGIRSASEVFQKHNETAFADIPGLHIVADDLIIAANDIDEHEKILHQVLQRAEDRNIKLNFDKLQLRMNEVKYLGTIVTPNGIRPDPAKVEAILGMPMPTDKAGVRRLLGMINFLAAHIPDMSTITAPVRDLLKSDVLFQWGPEQVKALEKIKEILSTAPVLSYYDPSARSTIQCDASQYGLGACLLQKGKPVAYASRSLLPAECNYAQIEKELLAIVFATQKFHQYIYGFQTNVQTDHKPLESIVQKSLHKVPPRLQRMLLKLQKYELSVNYVKGKDLHIADTLSRAQLSDSSTDESESEELELPVHTMIQNLPVSDVKKIQLQNATENDEQMQQLSRMIKTGWPANIVNVPRILHDYWKIKHNLHIADRLIFMKDRLVIPSSMRSEILKCIHKGHMGIEKCKFRARSCVYWPSMYNAIEQKVQSCPVCVAYSKQNQKEPLLPHPIPTRPWEKLGVDYFSLAGKDYLLVVDYYSKYPEVVLVESKTAESTIAVLKSIFARHGIPNTIVADNMPFNSKMFKQFAAQWDFKITTSSPQYPQSNGLVERNVQTIKSLFKKARDEEGDEDMALLEFRNTPITGIEASPAQLLMSRRLRSSLPMTGTMLKPGVLEGTRAKLYHQQQKQKKIYDKGARPLSDLKPGDVVRYQKGHMWKPAVVIGKHSNPRSYDIRTDTGGTLRRNRRHLRKTCEPPPTAASVLDDFLDDSAPLVNDEPAVAPEVIVPVEKRTRSGRIVRLPLRFRDD